MNIQSQIAIANAIKYLIFISAKAEYLKRGLEKADANEYASDIKKLDDINSRFIALLTRCDGWLESQSDVRRFVGEVTEFRLAPVVRLENGATPDEVAVACADLTSHCAYFRTMMRSIAVIRSYCPEACVRLFEEIFDKAVVIIAETAITMTKRNLTIQNSEGKEG